MFHKLAFGRVQSTSADQLRLMGREAAKAHIEEGVTLDEAVTKLVKEANLGRHEVGHVARSANQATWNTLHREHEDREAEFDPADPARIVRSLGVKPEHAEDALFDYMDSPPGEQHDLDLEAAFGKYASANYQEAEDEDVPEGYGVRPRLDPVFEKRASVVDTTREAVDRSLPVLEDAQRDFYHELKQAYLAGEPLTKIAWVVNEVMHSPAFAAACVKNCATRLEQEGVRFDLRLEKNAAARQRDPDFVEIPEPDHPLVKAAAVLEQATVAHSSAVMAHQRFVRELAARAK